MDLLTKANDDAEDMMASHHGHKLLLQPIRKAHKTKPPSKISRTTVFVLVKNHEVNSITNDTVSIANFTLLYNSLFDGQFRYYF